MSKEYKSRIISILKYLWQNIDEEHTATHAQIVEFLAKNGIDATPRSVATDIAEFIELSIELPDVLSELTDVLCSSVGSPTNASANVKVIM